MPANHLGLLDNIRFGNGNDGLRNYFRIVLKNDRKRALELINDESLRFGSLYQLRQECSQPGVNDSLRSLYRKALRLSSELSGNMTRRSEAKMRADGQSTHDALNWMIRTGYDEEDRDDGYDQLMERSAALLVKSFGDKTILPEIAEMIFNRNRKGKLIHELVWVFFEACVPESLNLIAQRLNSPDGGDVALARKLLNFIPCIASGEYIPGNVLYGRVATWLQENLPFLCYTGESLHSSPFPLHYAISAEAKYLCRPISAENGELLSILNPYESELLKRFASLPENHRKYLADFSFLLYRTSFHQWYDWVQLPLANQLNIAKQYAEGLA